MFNFGFRITGRAMIILLDTCYMKNLQNVNFKE